MFRATDEGPEQPKRWITVCNDCVWESDKTYASQDECDVSVCPECGRDNVSDRKVWV